MTRVQTELTARDVMTPDPLCVEGSATIRELARLLEDAEISGAPVVDQGGRLVGIVTKSDLIRICTRGTGDVPPAYLFEVLAEQGGEDGISDAGPEPSACVEDFMTEEPATVLPETPVGRIARRMAESRIHRVVVVDPDGFPIGIVTSLDLLTVWPR